jgi:hypothetical protein
MATNHLEGPLRQLLEALSPLKIMGQGIAALDSNLSKRITEAVQALNQPEAPLITSVEGMLSAWQKDQSEYFSPTVLEVVREYATWRERQDDLSDNAYCIGCGTHPKGPYTCATCVAADEHEGPQDFVSDWPNP